MRKLILTIIILIILLTSQVNAFEFAVISDFINANHLSSEQKIFASATLNSIKDDNPDFVLVPGDMVMGRWFVTEGNVREKGDHTYSEWLKMFENRDLTVYPAIGDHELGDLPAINVFAQGYLLPEYLDTYKRNFTLPQNGPKSMLEQSYYFVKENTLFITLQTFNINGWFVDNDISAKQLKWFENVLSKKQGKVDHIIVQGHLPIITVTKGFRSSHLTLKGGTDSKLWGIMKKYNVDYYLCGELHTTSIKEQDGITQIITNGFVESDKLSYALFSVDENIKFEIKEVKNEQG